MTGPHGGVSKRELIFYFIFSLDTALYLCTSLLSLSGSLQIMFQASDSRVTSSRKVSMTLLSAFYGVSTVHGVTKLLQI